MALTDKLTAIADAIRAKTGKTDSMTLAQMPSEIEGISAGVPINNQDKTITENGTYTADEGYAGLGTVNVSVPIPDGYVKPSGSLSITKNGEYGVAEKAGVVVAVETEPTLQEKTVNPTTSQQTATPDSGYDGLSKVIVNAMPTATQATPSISVNSSGLITASATQSAGYVASGTKSATEQLTTQAAKTVTPSTSEQTAVASGVYTTGAVKVAAIPSTYVKPSVTKGATTYTPTTYNQTIAVGTYCSGVQTIKGDANLKAENIAEGVSIFGVTGTHSGGSGGGSVETCTVNVKAMGLVYVVYMTSDSAGNMSTEVTSMSPVHSGLTVVCGSHVAVLGNTSNAAAGTVNASGAEMIVQKSWGIVSKITASYGETVEIIMTETPE